MTSGSDMERRGTGRSISYPFIDLGEAVERCKKLWDIDGTAQIPAVVAIEHWGYSPKSSGGGMTLSALVQYGLLDDSGVGSARKVKVSGLALDIIEAPDEAHRLAALRIAAARPKLHSEVLEQFIDREPSESVLKHFLLREKGFNPASVATYINSFRKTMEFAKLYADFSVRATSPRVPEAPAPDLPHHLQQRRPWEAPTFSSPSPSPKPAPPSTSLNSSAHRRLPEDGDWMGAGSGNTVSAVDRVTLKEGVVTIEWPTPLSKRGFEDMSDWLNLLIKRLGRDYEEQ